MKKIGHFNYFTFGLRKEWMAGVFQDGVAFLDSPALGPRQRDALVYFLRDCGLTDSHRLLTPLFGLLREVYTREGIDSKPLWAVLWVNLFYRSLLFHWYALLPKGCYGRQEMLDLMTQDYGKFNTSLVSGYTSLIGTFERTPLGEILKLGIVTKKGRTREVTKVCGVRLPPFVMLYALFEFAHFRSRFVFSLEEMADDHYFVTHIFCLGLKDLKDLLLSVESPEFFSSEMEGDVLTLRLEQDRVSLDVLRAFL